MSTFHKLRVKSIERETSKAVSVGFEIPDELKSKFKHVAGQYLTLEKEIAGKNFRRSYSICTSPNSGDLKVAVKEVDKGLFSAWINKKLKVGDKINVFLPEGRFTFTPSETANAKTYVSFAAGSGITPVMAILQNVLETQSQSKFVLVYGNKSPEETIFYKDLFKLQDKYPERLFLEFVYSKSKEAESFFGRIEKSTINYIIKNKYKNQDFGGFYICGPQQMIEMAENVLIENNIESDKIHHELFVAKDTEDNFKETLSGKTKVTVILDGEETTFEMDRTQRVLDAIMDEGLDPPYSCKGGICSSCMAQIEEGHVEMVNNQILTDGEVNDGLVLTCQSHPTTPTLTVNYDDI